MSRTLHLAICLFALAALPGCDSRARAIKSKLGPAEAQLFDEGHRIAGPCWTCHDFYEPKHKVGPSLLGIIGRRAGSQPGFHYSGAMRESQVVWSAATLSFFLQNPAGLIPGNHMVSPPLQPENARAVAYYMELATQP